MQTTRFHRARWLFLMLFYLVTLIAGTGVGLADDAEQRLDLLRNARRIVFLGDSITASGRYIACFEAWLATQRLERVPLVIDMGLPSETVSGLSEEGHAGGAFPRPDLAERLDRVLTLTQPDLVFACYGMNCGIYQPFDEGRLQRYRAGIQSLKSAVEKAGGKLVLITPPFYDARKTPSTSSYNGVLDRYSEWLLSQRGPGWQVIDLHGPMTREVERRRAEQPDFTFAPDGVHPNDAGQWFIARQLIRWFGDERSAAADSPEAMLTANSRPVALFPLVQQRMSLLRDAHVAAAGHKRPGVAKGMPVEQATEKAAELTAKIQTLLAP